MTPMCVLTPSSLQAATAVAPQGKRSWGASFGRKLDQNQTCSTLEPGNSSLGAPRDCQREPEHRRVSTLCLR
jgi:hypothetical protein